MVTTLLIDTDCLIEHLFWQRLVDSPELGVVAADDRLLYLLLVSNWPCPDQILWQRELR